VLSLYLDEDAQNRALVMALRAKGFDCLTANDAGRRGHDDESHLVFAARTRRVLYTKNTGDFRCIHDQWLRAGLSHSGIIALTRQRLPVGRQLDAIERIAREETSDELVDKFLYLLNHLP
jgi:hypothetical protein